MYMTGRLLTWSGVDFLIVSCNPSKCLKIKKNNNPKKFFKNLIMKNEQKDQLYKNTLQAQQPNRHFSRHDVENSSLPKM